MSRCWLIHHQHLHPFHHDVESNKDTPVGLLAPFYASDNLVVLLMIGMHYNQYAVQGFPVSMANTHLCQHMNQLPLPGGLVVDVQLWSIRTQGEF